MATPIVIAKNQTGTAIELPRLGLSAPPSPGTIQLTDFVSYYEVTCEEELPVRISAGDIVINDGTSDLSITEALDFLEASGNLNGPTTAVVNGLLKLKDVTRRYAEMTPITVDGSGNMNMAGGDLTAVGVLDATTLQVGGSPLELADLNDVAAGVGSAVQGNVLYFNGTSWTVLPPGTSGQYLQTQGAGANPQWATVTSTDELVKVTAVDTTPGYLNTKISVLNAGASWAVLNPGLNETYALSIPAASTTVAGLIEIATQAEVNTGTDTVRAVTPATLANTDQVSKKLYDAVVDPVAGKGTHTLLSAAISSGARSIFIRTGTYAESTNINVPDGAHIIGEEGGATIQFSAGTSFIVNGNGFSVETAGTIAVTNNSALVVGTGTTFSNLSSGDYIAIGTIFHEIDTIIDDENLNLTEIYEGDSFSGLLMFGQSMYNGVVIENIRVENSTITGVLISGLRQGRFTNFEVDNCANNIILSNSGDIVFEGCYSTNASSLGANLTNNRLVLFKNCRFVNNNGDGVQVGSNNYSVRFDGCASNNNGGNGYDFPAACWNSHVVNSEAQLNQGNGITISASANATVLGDDNLVAFNNAAQISNSSTSTIFGIGVAGNPTQGTVLYYNGSNWTRLPPGTSGQYLQTQGTGANPQWATVATGTTDHAALTNLPWASSGHTGTASRLAGFNGGGAASFYQIGADVQAWDVDLDAYAALASTGIVVRTGAGTVATRSLTQPATGITITNANGVGGNPTFALADDLLALENLASTGFATRTGANTWTQRSIQGSGNRITVTNGLGVGGNPIIDVGVNIIQTTTSLGGDLDGFLPNPTVTDLTISGEQQGSLLYFDGSNWTQLAPGTSGQFLQTQGTGADPQWGSLNLAIGDLSDVDTTTTPPTQEDFLRWDGSNWVPLKNNHTTTDPTASDDNTAGYSIGSYWINTSSDDSFVCLDASTGAAVWGELAFRNQANIFTESQEIEKATGQAVLELNSLTSDSLLVFRNTGASEPLWAAGSHRSSGEFRITRTNGLSASLEWALSDTELDVYTKRIRNVTDPLLAQDVATKNYVDSLSIDDLADVSLTGPAQGDLLYFNGTDWVNLSAGSSGEFLQTQGTGANPQWSGDVCTLSTNQTITGNKTFSGTTTYTGATNYNGLADFAGNVTLQSTLTVDTGSIDMGGFPLVNVPTPTSAGDAVNKAYVDNLVNIAQYRQTNNLTISTAATTVALNANDFQDSNYTRTGSDVTINAAGIYRVSYSVFFDTNANARRSIDTWVENNTVEITPSRGGGYARNTTDDTGSAAATFLVQLAASDVLRLRVQSTGTAGTCLGIGNRMWLTLELVRGI